MYWKVIKMAKTVNSAFRDFLNNEVNLDPNQSKRARNSRDYLLTNIAEFSKDADFFDLADCKIKLNTFEK